MNNKIPAIAAFVVAFLSLPLLSARAWHYEGHRDVAAVAIASLPEDFPEFARDAAAAERVMYLSGEPDRWRIIRDPALRHVNEPDHYIDFEAMDQYGLTAQTLPPLRNDLLGVIYNYRAAHPEMYAEEKPDETSVSLLFGLLPYSMNEYYLMLKANFVTLREMANRGASDEEISQARQSVLYVMGVLSHYAGDGAQPLHTTVHHHGWVGENPEGFTTSRKFHSRIDGGFIEAAGITFDGMKERVKPATCLWSTDPVPADANAFPLIVDYLVETHARVPTIYALDRDGKLDEEKPSGEGKTFIEDQLLRGGEFLGSLYYSAYKSAESVPLPPPLEPKPVPAPTPEPVEPAAETVP